MARNKYVSWILVIFILTPVITSAWRDTDRVRREPQEPRELRRGIHYHAKRHMPATESNAIKKRTTVTSKPKREGRKPSGHLAPLEDDDMDNDEVVSVAIGPSPLRPKFEKNFKKQPPTPKAIEPPVPSVNAVSIVKDVLTEMTREFLTRNVNENFVFGQYVGIAMKNLTNNLRINMQHDILDLIVKYQKLNNGGGDIKKEEYRRENSNDKSKDKTVRNTTTDGMDETWPDFKNLAGIA